LRHCNVGSGFGPPKAQFEAHARPMQSLRRPVLVINPVDDHAFAAATQQLLDEGILELDEFSDRLRVTYPDAAAHPREIAGEPILIWYVYREGRWVDPAAHSLAGASSTHDESARRPEGDRAVDPARREEDRRA
jgi:hypothetical protein